VLNGCKILSTDFAAASKNSEKKYSDFAAASKTEGKKFLLPPKDRHYVSD